MLQFFAKYKTLAIVLAVLSVIIIIVIYSILKPTPKLPVYQPDMVNAELVDTTVQYVRKYHKIADFNLVNQNGETITQDFYKDKIYVADFFFTTCLTICPIMTDNMLHIQEKIKNDPEVFLLSHTVFPVADSVPVLKKYATEKGVIDAKWNLVTGDKKHIYDLARKSYLASKTDGDGGPYDIIHTENFVLVDKSRRIRGFYDGTDSQAIEKLMDDIKILKAEYNQ
ncbi:SCO family protein [Antarcticibacterium arcticum]|uniref:SCO family protein n=1 Tax=Antarcticibacterium arcticum TaxID=2585771 RepID=A0A5B8YQC3_9FLAO|nr:SCO family protein [Antarcticibacterium arcticum]QED38586.1 SCO family protein [Antarcticibacterium arcticum]